MNIKEICELTGYKNLTPTVQDVEVFHGYTSDLLSDVMGNAPADSLLITIQAHKNTVAVASLADIKVIILCNGREATEEMLSAAVQEGVALFSTDENQFQASCRFGSLLGE